MQLASLVLSLSSLSFGAVAHPTAAADPIRPSPPAVHDRAARSWALVHAGRVWVCWHPAPRCFVPVVLEQGPEAEARADEEPDEGVAGDPAPAAPSSTRSWRLGYAPSGELWIELEGLHWRLDRGQRHAQASPAPPPVPLERARARSCSPSAQLPQLGSQGLSWARAPRCAPPPDAGVCLPAPRVPRLRRPTPLRLRAGVELASGRSWSARRHAGPRVLGRGLRADLQVLFVVELGLAPLAELDLAPPEASRRARLRAIPPADTASSLAPLHAREQRALAAIACAAEGQP